MTHLNRASNELFRRSPDERYESLSALAQFCRAQKTNSMDRWHNPGAISVNADKGLSIHAGNDGAFLMNDWSFTQLCRMAGVGKDTVNKLSALTAAQVFKETLPIGQKPIQLLTDSEGEKVRSIHGTQYTRLWNADLVTVLQEFAVDFSPPQKGMNGATGLYAGEQDMFAFLIDPLGWTEIDGEAFAPGFFIWNSEVGRRTLGIETFWFQAVCQNHIVWDATEVTSWTRKHTANVGNGLSEIRKIIAGLVEKRDQRKDGFFKVVKKAMETKLGTDADEVMKELTKKGFTRAVAKKAAELAQESGRFTIFSIVDALTRMSQEAEYAGDRIEADQKASSLLQLV
jgi:histone H3/H4